VTVDYETAWGEWDDMIRYSPAPFHRRRLIVDLARRLDFASVLDVGCAGGDLLATLGREFDVELSGVDVSANATAAAARRLPAATLRSLDLEHEALAREFDLVICSEVLEHCTELDRAIAHLRSMTSGHLIATVPAGPLFPIDRAVGHHRHFSRQALTDALGRHRFDVVEVRRWGFPFHSLYKLAINLRPQAMLDGFAGGTYSRSQQLVGSLVRSLFYLSVPGLGWQLIVLARAR